jgi:hypothetical protein
MEVSAINGNAPAMTKASSQQDAAAQMAARAPDRPNDGDADDGSQRAAMAIATGKGNKIDVSV